MLLTLCKLVNHPCIYTVLRQKSSLRQLCESVMWGRWHAPDGIKFLKLKMKISPYMHALYNHKRSKTSNIHHAILFTSVYSQKCLYNKHLVWSLVCDQRKDENDIVHYLRECQTLVGFVWKDMENWWRRMTKKHILPGSTFGFYWSRIYFNSFSQGTIFRNDSPKELLTILYRLWL